MFDPVAPGAEVASLARVQRPVDPLPGRQHLLDRSVADRVDPDLQAGDVAAVEELREVVIGV